MFRRRLIGLFTALILAVSCFSSAAALSASTLHNGSRGEDVRILQQALIDLGYLKGKADGIFGNQTENAVRAFQAAKRLTVDGLAGTRTRELLLQSAGKQSSEKTDSATSAQDSSSVSPAASSSSSAPSAASAGSLFSGNYATIRLNDQGARVKIMQQALIRLNYLSGKADGIFGLKTLNAVVLFQKENKLSADGLAGRKTLAALEKADTNNAVRGSSSAAQAAPAGQENVSPSSVKTGKAPDGSTIQLLHWFNDIKPSLKSNDHLLIYDPSTGIYWTLRVMSCGRHCDSEPLTADDTANMLKAFGGENTWSQKAVYVRLPSGIWTIGSTHDMPHLSGSISNNNFNGHLCVHFLRDMSEARENDPNYGVANQNTIRAMWKSLTGEELVN